MRQVEIASRGPKIVDLVEIVEYEPETSIWPL